ncbi:unnamed protein product [Brugia pahangi]|uniref:CPG4 domain-containing protein n=1 Tax=Brugia pahangi TaxID=6280 RepID=A0A0N4U080_BRUPA|nr:unnamed protein product [Brugia pahangi]
MGNQGDIDGVNKCSNECGHPLDATIQLDSSPFAPVNPFAITDSTTQICRTREQLLKCIQSCTNDEQEELRKNISLSEYICKDKLEGKLKILFLF